MTARIRPTLVASVAAARTTRRRTAPTKCTVLQKISARAANNQPRPPTSARTNASGKTIRRCHHANKVCPTMNATPGSVAPAHTPVPACRRRACTNSTPKSTYRTRVTQAGATDAALYIRRKSCMPTPVEPTHPRPPTSTAPTNAQHCSASNVCMAPTPPCQCQRRSPTTSSSMTPGRPTHLPAFHQYNRVIEFKSAHTSPACF
jgi:hypothetical protein